QQRHSITQPTHHKATMTQHNPTNTSHAHTMIPLSLSVVLTHKHTHTHRHIHKNIRTQHTYTHTHNTQNTHQYIKTQMHLPRTNSKYMLFICTSPDTWHFTLISLDKHTHTHTNTHTPNPNTPTHKVKHKHTPTTHVMFECVVPQETVISVSMHTYVCLHDTFSVLWCVCVSWCARVW